MNNNDLSHHERTVIKLVIDGVVWKQVSNFKRSRPDDRHYMVQGDADGRAVIIFGDGEHGARPSGEAPHVRATFRAGSSYRGVVLQAGCVQVDVDWNKPSKGNQRLCCLYRGVVINNVDPLQKQRLQVEVPEVTGAQPMWALPCLPVGASSVPAIGTGVWVAFENGDSAKPVWMGVINI